MFHGFDYQRDSSNGDSWGEPLNPPFLVIKAFLAYGLFQCYSIFQHMLKQLKIMRETPTKAYLSFSLRVIEQCFSEVPSCALKLSPCKDPAMKDSIDALGTLRNGAKEVTLLVVIRSSGEPRFVREALNALMRFGASKQSSYGLFVAPYISDEGAAMLSSQNVGYVDLSGNCRISTQGIFIRQEGRPNLFAKKRDLRSLYSPKAERVLRALLVEPKRLWKVKDISEVAAVSLGQVSNVKKLLDAREWLSEREGGFGLEAPEKLLSEWAANYRFTRHKSFEFYSDEATSSIEQSLAESRGGATLGVLTGFSAAARLSPMVRYKKVSAFVRQSASTVASNLGLKPVTSGGNVQLIEPYDNGVFLGVRFLAGLEIVSPVQTYLDLRSIAGRGEEAAEAVLREVLKPSW